MEKEERTAMEPEFNFYQVVIEKADEDENGKLKKVKEVHLVDGVNCTDVEKKVSEEMDGTLSDWKIVSMQQSKICVVY